MHLQDICSSIHLFRILREFPPPDVVYFVLCVTEFSQEFTDSQHFPGPAKKGLLSPILDFKDPYKPWTLNNMLENLSGTLTVWPGCVDVLYSHQRHLMTTPHDTGKPGSIENRIP